MAEKIEDNNWIIFKVSNPYFLLLIFFYPLVNFHQLSTQTKVQRGQGIGFQQSFRAHYLKQPLKIVASDHRKMKIQELLRTLFCSCILSQSIPKWSTESWKQFRTNKVYASVSTKEVLYNLNLESLPKTLPQSTWTNPKWHHLVIQRLM